MTLTQASILTKQFIFISVSLLVIGIFGFIGYSIWQNYYLSTLPPQEEIPDAKFGNLPPPDFPPGNVSSSNFTYSLDTASGNLPKIGDADFPKIIKVYFVTKPYASFLSSEKSKELASKFGINIPEEILSDTKYRFKDNGRTLDVDLDSGNFSYKNEASISAFESLDDDNKLIDDFKRILNSLGIFKDENIERTKITLLKEQSGQLTPTQLRSEAKAAQISIWQQSLDKFSIYTPDFNKALVNAEVFGTAQKIENYISLQFIFWPIDQSTFATYFLKDPSSAFANLQGGKGVIIIEPQKGQVSITSIYLGYFLPKDYSPYLQPIYIFEGPNFVAYVSAI